MLIWQQMNIYLHKIMSFNHEAPPYKVNPAGAADNPWRWFRGAKKSTLDNNDDFLHCPTDGLPSVVG